jgi:hypothetical protein
MVPQAGEPLETISFFGLPILKTLRIGGCSFLSDERACRITRGKRGHRDVFRAAEGGLA